MIASVVFAIPLKQEFSYIIPDSLGKLSVGTRVVAPLRNRKLKAYIVAIDEIDPQSKIAFKSIISVIDKEPLINQESIKLAQWLSAYYFCSLGEALNLLVPNAKEDRDYEIQLSDDEIEKLPSLSTEQLDAVSQICDKPDGMFYLFGATGTGKTEVYLQAAKKTLEEGRSVLFLVPEIALTRQMIRAVEQRFSGQCAVLHSKLSASQRLKQWKRILNGEALFVVGARSSVFAPLQRLGLIIIDEEHESSYKSGSTPRYHARQVAMYRAQKESSRILFGSATPSLEAWYLIAQNKMPILTLSQRLAGGAMPKMETIELLNNETSLSARLIDEINITHAAGRQTILFLNRRGYSYFFNCKSCHKELTCPHCSVSLTYHKDRHMMVCHYCSYQEKPSSICPHCGSLDVSFSGFGTEKVEQDIVLNFPHLKIARIDTDTTKKKGELERIIEEFRKGETDLLLGTQMVAKGLNFPGVRLVGIINADVGLKMPDFRAAERSFSLITQVAGRAGRYHDDGLVLIQSFDPANIGIQKALSGDIQGFYTQELEQRKKLNFPPYTRMIRLVFRGAKSDNVLHSAKEFLLNQASKIKKWCEVLGPAECSIFKINNSYRYQILLIHESSKTLHSLLAKALEGWQSPSTVYLEIDVDPVGLM